MSEKTIADVLDKSIDKLSGGASEIAKAVKQVAPHAWEAAVRQQVIEGITDLAFGLLVLAIAVVAARCILPVARGRMTLDRGYQWTPCKPGEGGTSEMMSGTAFAAILALCIGGPLLVLIGANYVKSSVPQIANPEFYAAKAILEAVK